MVDDVVKPCPFCGSPGEVVQRIGGWTAGCSNLLCGIEPMTYFYDDKADAINAWNVRNGVKDDDAPVEDAQRTLHLGGKVDVAGRVDQVDLVAVPFAGDGGGLDGDAALALLRHIVGHRGAVVDVAQAVRAPGVKEHTLGGGGLARIDVGDNAYISCFEQTVSGCHIPYASHTKRPPHLARHPVIVQMRPPRYRSKRGAVRDSRL